MYWLLKRKGVFIVIEGIDGAGKTVVALEIVKRIKKLGIEVIYTHEPYTSPFSKALKQLSEECLDPELEALALAADRYIHVKKVIEPAFKKGIIVISDRYYYSSIAYQGAKGANVEWIETLNNWAPNPDLAIYLDVEPEEGLRRRANAISEWPHFEKLTIIKKAREIYSELVKKGKLICIDAMKPLNIVIDNVWNCILELLKKRNIVKP